VGGIGVGGSAAGGVGVGGISVGGKLVGVGGSSNDGKIPLSVQLTVINSKMARIRINRFGMAE